MTTITNGLLQVESTGTKLLAGFADGVVRLLALNKVDPSQLRSKKSKLKFELNLEQVFKPHTKAVTVLTIDEQGELLATGVSLQKLKFPPVILLMKGHARNILDIWHFYQMNINFFVVFHFVSFQVQIQPQTF